MHLSPVVLQINTAINAVTGLRATKTQPLAACDQRVVFQAFGACKRDPAPAGLVGNRRPLGLRKRCFLLQLQFSRGAPADARDALVRVLYRRARPAVRRYADAQNNFLQLGFTHLHLHGGGSRVAVGVDKHICRIEVAAGSQPLLRLDQPPLVVHRAFGQTRQTRHQHRVIALHAADLHSAEPIQRPRVKRDQQACRAIGRIHIGQAAGQFAGRIAARHQIAQRLGFGVVPCALREGAACRQPPVAPYAVALTDGVRIG